MHLNDSQWNEFIQDITDIYEIVKENKKGKVADYIPQLANVEENNFAISICTIDGKTFNIGDHSENFCIQSCSKTLTYALALKEHGREKVHNHIGIEPSGHGFNAFIFNKDNKPFNSLINSGAIVASSLIKPNLTEDQRFEFLMSTWKRIVGKDDVGFDNAVYLSEKRTANRNRALAYLMKENNVFEPGTDIDKTLELYFQFCSITMNSSAMARFAAMLANGGTSVTAEESDKILESNVVKDVLSVMYSSGMYDYSGRWAFYIGLPAKSGVAGCIYAVIPNICGICVYSPKLDSIGNSVRGIDFFTRLVDIYKFHVFDNLDNDFEKKKDFTKPNDIMKDLCEACQNNQPEILEKLIKNNDIDINKGDYDDRCPLHIATEEKNYDCIRILIEHGANVNAEDRWKITPLTKALEYKDAVINKLFKINQTSTISYSPKDTGGSPHKAADEYLQLWSLRNE